MLSVLVTAWHVIVKRAAADRLILAAASITVVIATVLMAAGPIYADAVLVSGAQRSMRDAPVTEANLEVTVRLAPERFVEYDQIVLAATREAFSLTGGTVLRHVVSESFELPTQPSTGVTDIATFEHLQAIEDHASLIDGRWPNAVAAEPFETAIPASTAAALDLAVGNELLVRSRRDNSTEAAIAVVGIYRLGDATDPFWFDDDLALAGLLSTRTFRTFGPFVVDLETMLRGFSNPPPDTNWRVFPDYENLTVAHISGMRSRVQGLEQQLNADVGEGVEFSVASAIPRILIETERSLLVTRSGVFTLTLQLAILAGYALLLTAGLLAESRRGETTLLRSRGAASGQILAMAVMEGALLVLPAALLAPWIATLALRALNTIGPLASIGLTIEPAVTRGAFILSLLAGVGCVIALAVPAYRSGRSFNESTTTRVRESSRGAVQRAGADIALLVFAGVAFWQLRRFSTQITSTVEGRLGIDPLLVAAPALGLLAGAVLALRSLPMIAQLGERRAAAGVSTVRALAGWQVSRRPRRHARASLLLIMTLGIGIFAAAYTSTWRRSQEDQAGYQIGADIRLSPNRRGGDSIPEMHLQSAHQQLDALDSSMAVVRRSGQLSATSRNGRFMMLDAAVADSVVVMRPDLATRAFGELMAELASRRPALNTVRLPGEPQRIGLDFSVQLEPLPEDFEIPEFLPEARIQFTPQLRVVLQDGADLMHRLDIGPVPVDVGQTRVEADLLYTMNDGTRVTPIYPISIVEIEIFSPSPLVVAREARIEFGGIVVSEDPDGRSWRPAPADLASANWTLTAIEVATGAARPSIGHVPSDVVGSLAFKVNSGIGTGRFPLPVFFGLRPTGDPLPDRIPVIVTERFLEAADSRIGDEIRLSGFRQLSGRAEIVGTIIDFPTVDPATGEAILMDLPTLQMMSHTTGADLVPVDERWIDVGTGDIDLVASDLAASPYESLRVADRKDRALSLLSDPVALGSIGSLSIGFVAAAIFAAVGFAVTATVSARERLTEFALLRALGLSQRQLAAWLSVENGMVVLLSLMFGTAIGLLLSWLILPLISITQEATTTLPAVTVVFPWRTIVSLELVVVGTLVVIVAVAAAALKGLGLGSLLRLGEE